ncbi:Mbov_0396 family ICE element transmembrane protein [Spiroplasma endosymbiont of Dromius quadrimaculatus]|uniref:Mbov_0396 family ICE element transmembrane protein n=1 Tax=Spiroplasma endosymbiont of Dromius quadrimaculatus TaxID=3066283 RepID=UPI00313AE83B
MIMNALYRLIWSIFVQGPLQLIGSFNNVLNYLTGGVVGDLMFGSKQEFSFQNIPMAFWYFVITALCLFSLIFTITMIKILFQDATEAKTKFIVALQNGSKAFVFIFLIPIFFFLANFAIANIAKMITSGFGGENGNIANYLYNIGNKYWDGSGDNIPSNYAYPDNIGDFNMIAEVFGVWFMLFAMFMIGIALVQKIIELFFLFIISPWVMVAMTIDNGKGAFIWKDMVIAKFLASTATLTGYFIFMTTIQTILSTNLAGLGIEGYGKSLFIILMMCGGGLAVLAFSDVVANLIGEAAGIREGMNSMRSTVGPAEWWHLVLLKWQEKHLDLPKVNERKEQWQWVVLAWVKKPWTRWVQWQAMMVMAKHRTINLAKKNPLTFAISDTPPREWVRVLVLLV